eukprot:10656816-Alexandrium_andersonii.AAC.1
MTGGLSRSGSPLAALLVALMVSRSITAPLEHGLSQPLPAVRSLGIGGTPSPLLWAIAYDPVVSAVADGTGCATPIF